MASNSNDLRLTNLTQATSSRPLFVFLPGMDGTCFSSQSQAVGLGSSFDVRGLFIPPCDRSGWSELTERVATLILLEQSLHPGRATIICGESFGGCLALSLVSRFPDLCNQLILVNPASSARQQPWISSFAFLAELLPATFYKLSTFSLLGLLIASHRVRKPMRQKLLSVMQAVGPQNAAWRLSLLSKFDVDDFVIDRPPQSILILASGADRLLPSKREASRLSQRFPRATTVLLPESGHACLLEDEIDLSAILKGLDR
jgi:pimeloyl-ACP methyl ester carboxylesterase